MAQGDEKPDALSDNAIIKLSRQLVDSTDEYDGENFFTTGSDGVRKATPLLLALICLELSDLVFAVSYETVCGRCISARIQSAPLCTSTFKIFEMIFRFR